MRFSFHSAAALFAGLFLGAPALVQASAHAGSAASQARHHAHAQRQARASAPILERQTSTNSSSTPPNSTVLIGGGGLAGLEGEASLGGQAWWSFGGIFHIDSPEQRSLKIKDSFELAKRDWYNSAQFDDVADQDYWGSRWAEAYLQFAHKNLHAYLRALGVSYVPQVGWAERGSGDASGHGNSVPRFHIISGTGEEAVKIFRDPVLKAATEKNLVTFKFRHQVDSLLKDAKGRVVGVQGTVLEPTHVTRGEASSRKAVGSFKLRGRAVILATGGIGGNVDLVKKMWPVEQLGGKVPDHFVVGVPAHVDGRGLGIAEAAGARLVNQDRFWHYTEVQSFPDPTQVGAPLPMLILVLVPTGLTNWKPIWPGHGIRVIPGPSSLWLDATGKRLPAPLIPGCDTLATLKHICKSGYDYTWFVLTKKIILKEFALSGSEQNPDLTQKDFWLVIQRILFGAEPVKNFMKYGEDFVVSDSLSELVKGMNALVKERNGPSISHKALRKTIEDRDFQLNNTFSKDAQWMLINNARNYGGDKALRVAEPHAILDASAGPLIAIRMNLLTRKTLGGIQTDLKSRVIKSGGAPGSGEVIPGLYAAGEVAGFGGGGVMGHNALEGTFLTGAILSSLNAARHLASL
ncbi:hypothetical protein V8E36_009423 [Tilletia maclaganii]